MHRYLYALNLDKAIETITQGCHHCALLYNVPHTVAPQSTNDPPEVVGIAYGADIIKWERQLILVARECVTSYTVRCNIKNERHETLRDTLITLCIGMRPLGGPPTVELIQHQDSLHLSTTNFSPNNACPWNWDV